MNVGACEDAGCRSRAATGSARSSWVKVRGRRPHAGDGRWCGDPHRVLGRRGPCGARRRVPRSRQGSASVRTVAGASEPATLRLPRSRTGGPACAPTGARPRTRERPLPSSAAEPPRPSRSAARTIPTSLHPPKWVSTMSWDIRQLCPELRHHPRSEPHPPAGSRSQGGDACGRIPRHPGAKEAGRRPPVGGDRDVGTHGIPRSG